MGVGFVIFVAIETPYFLMIKHIGLVILFFLGTTFLFPQQTDSQKELLKRAKENLELLSTDLEKAFKEANEIEKEAQRINAKEAELKAINTKCTYYRIDNDFENMMATAKSLHRKALLYKSPLYQLIARRFIFESYLFRSEEHTSELQSRPHLVC